MSSEEHKRQTQLCSELADTLAPGLLKEVKSFILLVADDEGFSYSFRGSLAHLQVALDHANTDIQSSSPENYQDMTITEA